MGTGIAKAPLTRVFVGSNSVGIRTDGTGSTGGIHLTVTDSTISGNTNAFTPAGGAASNIFANRIVSVNNGTGYLADGSGAGVFLNNPVATANSTGVSAVNIDLHLQEQRHQRQSELRWNADHPDHSGMNGRARRASSADAVFFRSCSNAVRPLPPAAGTTRSLRRTA